MQDPVEFVDLNSASREQLEELPGITSQLAERILAARPFESLEDLQKVKGLRRSVRQDLHSRLVIVPLHSPPNSNKIASAEESVPVDIDTSEQPTQIAPQPILVTLEATLEEQGNAVSEEDVSPTLDQETIPVAEPSEPIGSLSTDSVHVPDQEPGELPETALAEPVRQISSRSDAFNKPQVLWLLVGTSLLTFIMAVVFTLGFLMVYNEGLQYAGDREYNQLRWQLTELEDQLSLLDKNQQVLESSVTDLVALGEQVSSLERKVSRFQNTLDEKDALLNSLSIKTTELSAQVDDLVNQVGVLTQQTNEMVEKAESLAAKVEELTTRSNIFQKFLDGLKGLFD